MLDVHKTDQGIIVNNQFCFTEKNAPQGDFVTLGLTCGDDVMYGDFEKSFINYPGEYQQDNIIVFCFMSKDNLLNYIIKSVDLTFALVQDAKSMNANAFEGVTDIIAFHENVSNQLQKLDLQCEIIAL